MHFDIDSEHGFESKEGSWRENILLVILIIMGIIFLAIIYICKGLKWLCYELPQDIYYLLRFIGNRILNWPPIN